VQDDDPFYGYGVKRVRLEHGLEGLRRGDGRAVRHLDAGQDLFDLSAVRVDELIQRALRVEEPAELLRYEEALSLLVKRRPDAPRLREALSLVVSRRAVGAYNEGRVGAALLEQDLRRALALDADNAHAASNLESIQPRLQLTALERALDHLKLNRAAALVRDASSPQVQEAFFERMDELFDAVLESDLEEPEQIVTLIELRSCCADVNPAHGLIEELDEMIDELQEA